MPFKGPAHVERYVRRLTQNANESFHSRMWGRASKAKFAGFSRLSFVAESAVLDHNFGYRKACLLTAFNIKSQALRRSLETQDEERNRHSQAQKKQKTSREETSTQYEPGAF